MHNFYIKQLLVAMVALLCSVAASAHDFEVGGVFYKVTSETNLEVEVTYKGSSNSEYSDEYSGSVVIPKEVTYNGKTYSVTSIGECAFYKCSSLTNATIGNSVTSIGKFAFQYCKDLTKIEIPSSVTFIGDAAFEHSGIVSIALPASLTNINAWMFNDCSSLKTVTIPASITSIGNNAFKDCPSLTSVTIPNSVTSIENDAFYNCSSLKTVINHSSLTISKGSTDNGYVSYYADKVINAPNGSIEGDFVFGKPNGVNTLCGYIGNATNLTLPENYKGENYVIGEKAFEDCSSLASVTIPNSVTSIRNDAFKNCSSLKTVTNHSSLIISKGSTDNGYVGYYADKVINTQNDSDFIFSKINGNNTLCDYTGNATNLTLPANYKGENYVIGEKAFYKCKSLTSVTIPNSVTSIGKSAFDGCSGITSVTIGNSVTSIGNDAFYDCWSLTSITIPNSVTSIGNDAFCYCRGLTSVTIPNSVTSIGNDAFYNCYRLTSVTIGNSVTSIGNYAFYACYDLKTVINYSSLTISKGSTDNGYVGYYADKVINDTNYSIEGDFVFKKINEVNTLIEYLGNATELSLPENYKGENYVIGEKAFYDCDNLTSITIPNSVTSIGDYAFKDCPGLTSVTIPNSVTSIGKEAFKGCSGLKDVYISDLAAWCNIDHSTWSNPMNYAQNLFLNGELLTNVVIPDDVDVIKDEVFNGCSCITSVTLGKNVTKIGRLAFQNCTGLTNITIPNSVTSIGDYAFLNCDNLKTVINLSSLTISKGSTDNGYVGYYADKVINAPNGSIEGDFVWAKIDGNNTLCVYIGNATELSLPENYKGENYVIGDSAFYDCDNLTSVTIPNSVTSIGDKAFYNCDNLKTVINLSSLTISKGSTDNGYVGYYADKVTIGLIEGDFVFKKNNGVNTLIEYLGNATELSLPENYKGENYVIGDSAFSNCSGLTSVTIPNSVTSIGDYAFNYCVRLKSVIIGNSVTSIGNSAFQYCRGLTSVTIPNSVTSIGDSAFYECSGLKSVTIGNSVTSIGDRAFYDCRGLKSVTIGNSVTSIGNYAFKDCSGLTSVTIPNSVTSIGNQAFYRCSDLTSVTIGNSVTSIGKEAFWWCSDLTSVTIGNSVTSIGDDAFDWCSSLKTVINLSSLTISKGSTSNGDVGYYADKVINAPNSSIEGDFVWAKIDGHNTLCVYIGNATELSLPENYKGENYVIGDYAFYGCSGLKTVTIPNSVTSIGNYAFSHCSGLTSVTIPNSVTSIGNYAFQSCSGLKTVTIPNSVTSIGDYAFHNSNSLTSVIIPNSVTSIGYDAFYGCSSLKDVYISDLTAWCNIDFKNNTSNPLSHSSNLYLNGELVKDLTIPNSVTSIGNYAFYSCSSLTSVTIPNSVTSIGNSAFALCSSLKDVYISDLTAWCNIDFKNNTSNPLYYSSNLYLNGELVKDLIIPNSVTSIGDCAFDGCSSLTSITIPNSVTSIGDYSFKDCPGLKSVIIGNSVTSIGREAFEWCSSLKTVINYSSLTISIGSTNNGYVGYYADKVTIGSREGDFVFKKIDGNNTLCSYIGNATELSLPENIYYVIGDYTFSGCSSLTSITIPNSVTSIGISAFDGCSSLTSVTIPNSVTSIGDYSFKDCPGLKSVIIGNSVTSIGREAFEWCSSLTGVTIGNSVTSIGDFAFSGCTSIKDVYISDLAAWCNIDFEDPSSNPLYYSSNLYLNGELVKDLIIPNSVTSIGDCAFDGCSSLTSITIPNSVTSIGDRAFDWCSGIERIVCTTPQPPIVGIYNFTSSHYQNATLYVPKGSLATYQSAEVWKDFWDIQEFDATDINAASADATVKVNGNSIALVGAENCSVAIYSTNSALIEKIDAYAGEEIILEKGVYIICIGSKSIKVKL